MMDDKMQKISVIIPTLNRGTFLENSLSDMINQDYNNYEIIIVDQSKLETSQKIQQMANENSNKVRYIKVDFKGLLEARNYGFQKARGDILIYIDDDIRAERNFIYEHVRMYSGSLMAMVAGGIEEPRVNSRRLSIPSVTGKFNKWLCSPIAGFDLSEECFVDHVKGVNFSIKKSVLQETGGFDENLNIGAALYEELELCLRVTKLGHKIFFNPKAKLRHLVAPSGGCRISNNIPKYIFGLAHNRSLLIFRHLKLKYRFTALMRLFLLILSSCRIAKSFKPFFWGLRGVINGMSHAKHSIKITRF
jgi:GT2 family glycosyltransferase